MQKRLFISRTAGEWEEIQKQIEKKGKSDLSAYLRGGLKNLQEQFAKCPGCVTPASGKKKKVQYYIPDHLYPVLEELSEKMGRPISSIVEDFFIVPLLLPGKA